VAMIRALAQWVLDYTYDGSNLGFPFDRPYLDLYRRCFKVRRAVDAFLRRPPDDVTVRRALQSLARILDPIVSEPLFAATAATLTSRATLFDELRATLRLHPPTPKVKSATTPEETATDLHDIQQSLEVLTTSLRRRRPERGPAQDTREAIDLVLDHIERHGHSLWGHAIDLPQDAGASIRIVDRTNNQVEGYFHGIKRGERRRSGRKSLTHDFECLPAAAALATNLTKSDYVHLLCGSLERLPAAFAAIDAAEKTERFATPPSHRPPQQTSMPEIATASLPRQDRPTVRATTLKAFIEAAARSRAPRVAATS